VAESVSECTVMVVIVVAVGTTTITGVVNAQRLSRSWWLFDLLGGEPLKLQKL